MIIGLDYDDTYTAAPEFFQSMINWAISYGFVVIIVTGRNESDYDVINDALGQHKGNIPIVCAGTAYKRDAAKARGYDVNIWIDDAPEWVSDAMLRARKKAAEADLRRRWEEAPETIKASDFSIVVAIPESALTTKNWWEV